MTNLHCSFTDVEQMPKTPKLIVKVSIISFSFPIASIPFQYST